jgi:hypothetical protein
MIKPVVLIKTDIFGCYQSINKRLRGDLLILLLVRFS